MKKIKSKLILIGSMCSLILGLTIIPIVLVSLSNTKKAVASNEKPFNISFKTSNDFIDLEFSNKLASSVDAKFIKKQVINNKEKIFNNADQKNDDFYDQNLVISNINSNDYDGTVTFKLELNNCNSNNESINKSFKFTGFQINNQNNYYTISFNETTTYNYGDQNYYASDSTISSTWIKNKLIANKGYVFKTNNISSSYNWNANLNISSISPNDDEGKLTFVATLNEATNDPSKTSIIEKELTFTGFSKIQPPNPDEIIIDDNPENIPNDRPEKEPITQEEIKWGNVLLPKVDDNKITMDDLVEMLDKHIGNMNYVKVTFGERKINASLMADAFAKWITTRWKYFPYLAFSNPVFKINIKDESGQEISWKNRDWNNEATMNETFYVHSLSTYKGEIFDYYADKWLNQGFYKDSFIEFVNNFLNLISHDMSGIDKAWTAYYYVANYLNYEDSSSIEATIVNHKGVCADYASLMSLLCNIVGVPSLPMVTSHNNINYSSMHEIVWVYIDDLLGTNTKKWYAMDPTFAYGRGGSYNAPISFWANNLVLENIIFNFSSNPYDIYPSDEHYNSNLFFNVPWKKLYDNNSLETRKIPDTLVSTKYNHKSNPVYYDGYWYYYCYDNKYPTDTKNNNKLVRSKFVTSDTYEVVIDFANPSNPDPNKFGFNVSNEICEIFKWFSQSSFRYHSFGYNEKIVLATNVKNTDYDNSVKFLIIDLKTKECKLINQTFEYRKSSLKDFNFYIKDGNIYYTDNPYGEGQNSWKDKTYSKLDLTSEEYDFLNSTSVNNSKLYRKILLYRTIASTYMIGTDPVNNVSKESKKEFLQYLYNLEQELNNGQIKNFDDTIKQLEIKYNSFIPKITSEGIIKMNELSDVYQYEEDYVNQIDALPLNKLLLIDNLSDLISNNNNIAFDIYHSKTKSGNFKKVREELYLDSTGINVRLKDVDGSYQGYYYFEYYPYGLNNEKKRTKTFEIQIVKTKTLPDYEGLFSQSKKNTNYYDNSKNWYENKIALNITLHNMLNIKNEITLKLKYLNPETKQEIVLDTLKLNKGNSSITHKWAIDKPSKNNHGIYWIEYDTIFNEKTAKFYSNFYYHFTKDDIDNFDVSKWSTLSNMIR